MPSSTPEIEDYHVAWIAALPIEFSAATAMLDEHYEHRNDDTTLYTLGRIGSHNIVVACLPAGHIGTTSAATSLVEVVHKFPALRVGLLVGIGAGVPSPEADIRLGDVVISQPTRGYGGVIHYDFGKVEPDGQHRRIGYLNGPPLVLLSALSKLRWILETGTSEIGSHLRSLQTLAAFRQTNTTPDHLFRADYKHQDGPTCENCDPIMVVTRPERDKNDPSIVLHCGLIASGNQVMRDGVTRDKLSSEFGGVFCFEMEAAGLLNILPCLVIRGISDYADSHKNKTWQPRAAGNAAAYAKELLKCVPPFSTARRPSSEGSITRNSARSMSLRMKHLDLPRVDTTPSSCFFSLAAMYD
ncbi:nucleoside phosphorylase domain-containing protein [Aspergillus pseudodeflectus]|uniref:Nucleoside phosphorylase domain-containing protein n=1 Tax=Aspergillus pseudodeflectus TaxID=176178 RepID=A0ABR4L1S5_9EURO